MQQGLDARDVVVTRFIPLVLKMSRKFAFDRAGKYDEDTRTDMIAVGNLALAAAMPGYVHIPGRGIAPFAKTCVRRAMLTEAMQRHREHTGLSHKMQRMLADVMAERNFLKAAGQDITLEEVAEKLGYRPKRFALAMKLSTIATVSVDQISVDRDDKRTLLDRIPDESAQIQLEIVEDTSLLAQIVKAAHDLRRRQVISDVEWKILVARYGDGKTQQQIADSHIEGITSQGGVDNCEKRVLAKIRKHIEDPHYYERLSRSNFRIVESAVDLLTLLDIPITPKTDMLAVASNIVNGLRITTWQREVMRSLLGLDGKHYRPHELAKERNRSYRAIYDAREKATKNIIDQWADMSSYERKTMCTVMPPKPNTAPSVGPRPNVMSDPSATNKPIKLDPARIITRALVLKSSAPITKAEADSFAKQGLLPDAKTIADLFRGWRNFQSLVRQLKELT